MAGPREIARLGPRPVLACGSVVQSLVDRQFNPHIEIQPGETQHWRSGFASANNFFNLQLARHQLHQIATDGDPPPGLATVETLLLAPAERAEVLVQGGPAGIYEFRSIAWAQDVPSQAQPPFGVATMISSGEAIEPATLPTELIDREDLSQMPIDGQRTVTFQENASASVVAIDGKAFDEDRVDQTVTLGTVEE